MKKIFLSVTLLLTVAVATAFSNDGTRISKAVEASFKKEFPGSEVLSWTSLGEYSRAVFILGGHRTEAYFSEDGQLRGSIRYLFFSQLPLAVMTAVDKRYPSAEISEVHEITNDEGTNYRISLEKEGKKYNLKADACGNITQTERVKK